MNLYDIILIIIIFITTITSVNYIERGGTPMFKSLFCRRATLTIGVLLLLISSLMIAPQAVFAQSSTASISPSQAPAGTNVTGSGSNWAAGDTMLVQWADGTTLATTTIGSNGTFTVTFTVPSNATQGVYTVYFTDQTAGYFIPVSFTVSTSTSNTLTIQALYTRDGNGNVNTTFAPGDAIQYVVNVNNSNSSSMTIMIHYEAFGPNQNYIFDQIVKNVTIPQGASGWYVVGTVPTNAPAGTYTMRVHVFDQSNINNTDAKDGGQFTVTSTTSSGGLIIPSTGTIFNLFLDTSSNESWYHKYYDQNNILHNQPKNGAHSGVDISNGHVDCQSSNPVYAAGSGQVIWAGWAGAGFGWSVVVRHGYGLRNNGHYTFTLYGHMGTVGKTTKSSKSCLQVKVGDQVSTTTIVGYQGSSGLTQTGKYPPTHVHFMIFAGNQDVTSLSSPYDLVNKYSTYPASPDFYTCLKLTLGDSNPLSYVTYGQSSC